MQFVVSVSASYFLCNIVLVCNCIVSVYVSDELVTTVMPQMQVEACVVASLV